MEREVSKKIHRAGAAVQQIQAWRNHTAASDAAFKRHVTDTFRDLGVRGRFQVTVSTIYSRVLVYTCSCIDTPFIVD